MRRLMFLICLTATTSGPLLRQSEGAGDFVRALDALLDVSGTLAETDGGVGDDSGEMTLRAGGSHDFQPAGTLCPELSTPRDSHWTTSLACALLALTSRDSSGDRAPWLPPDPRRRRAWLQLYRF